MSYASSIFSHLVPSFSKPICNKIFCWSESWTKQEIRPCVVWGEILNKKDDQVGWSWRRAENFSNFTSAILFTYFCPTQFVILLLIMSLDLRGRASHTAAGNLKIKLLWKKRKFSKITFYILHSTFHSEQLSCRFHVNSTRKTAGRGWNCPSQ